MKDVLSQLSNLRRPELLIRTARLGAQEYRREVHLPRHIGYRCLPRSGAALMRLMDMEIGLNDQRRDKDASYSLLRHVDVLIAMMGEARLLRASQGQ